MGEFDQVPGAEVPEAATSGARADLVEPGRRLFQFLRDAQRLRISPVRTTDAYERDGAVFWLGMLPEHPAVSTAAHEAAPSPEAPLLTVRRVPPQDPPTPDDDVRDWLDGLHTDPQRPPALCATRTEVLPADPGSDGAQEVQTVHLEDRPQIDVGYRGWRTAWDTWAAQELADRPVRQLYKNLFAAYTIATNQPEDLELVLGVGCLAWAPSGHERVRRHTLVTPAAIAFEESTGTLIVRAEPALDSLTLELDMLDPSRGLAPRLRQDVVERARGQEVHPLDRAVTGDLLQRLVNGLDPDGRYDDSDTPPTIGPAPVLAFAPAVVLRCRSQLGLVAVFEQIEAAIAVAGAVPSGLVPLLDPDHVPAVAPDPTPGAMVDVDDEVFLPLPLNDRQLDIIQRVDRQAQTLVQGPPGTGKTHLAAALISHLLAQGKRVLVTAHTDRALKEVRGKLPVEITPLAVAVVGHDRSDLADLKTAVERISSRSNDGDPVARDAEIQAQIDASLAKIEMVRRRRAELRARLLQAREGDVAERSFTRYNGTLAAIAHTYQDQAAAFGWLLHHLTPDVAVASPVAGAEAARWRELLADVAIREDETEASSGLVDLAQIPTPDEYGVMLDRSAAAQTGFAALSEWADHPAFEPVCSLVPETRAALQQRMTELAHQIAGFERRREPWMAQALLDIRTGRAATWRARAQQIDDLLRRAWAGLQQLGATTRVIVADGADHAVVQSLAEYLLAHVQGGGTVKLNPDGSVKSGAFTGKAVKSSRPLFDAVRVDGRPPTTAEQLTAVLIHLDVERHLLALDQAWPENVHVPAEDTLAERVQWHITELQQLQALLEVGRRLAAEEQRCDDLSLPHPDWNDLVAVTAFARLVDAAAARDVYRDAAAPLHELAASTATAARQLAAASACAELSAAVHGSDRQAYAVAYQRIRRLHEVKMLAAERDALTRRMAAAAPDLVAAVAARPDDDAWATRLADLDKAWDWARTGEWIMHQESEDANELQQQLDIAEDSLRAEIERLAAVRAWRHALSPTRLTGQARADLNYYVRLVRRLGKGTGKYAAAQRAEIRQAMDRCRPAVPVWIMPIYRIAEQLHVTENMFDVVIVDEASQAGLEATFLQFLAPKIVVIGDDKQVSPSAVGVDQQQLRDLAGTYLADHRYRASWQDPKLSLFDAASIWYGAKRTLVEHRRCVPEIIGFSNRIAYEPENIRLIPVRQFGADRLNPVKPVHVIDGYETGGSGTKVNRPEAESIVTQIEKCLADPRYDGKTFGVISLLGPRQAKVINDMLLERVPPDEWTARDLRCGDAAAFQGSERHVMFLSMVSAPEPGQRLGALTLEAYVQRYNVAASRAKDQMWVFHTVTLDQLTNPEDMRFQLLDYCYHGVQGLRADDGVGGLLPEDRLVPPFESLFEQRVHNRIVARGYTVVPQAESLGYSIDLVVIGAKGRLAVECDGDFWHGPEQYLRDLGRERDLRRCGWEFFRVKESSFYVDEHGTLARLWAVLDELEIRPAGWSDSVESDAVTDADDAGELEPMEEVSSKADLVVLTSDYPAEVSGRVMDEASVLDVDLADPEEWLDDDQPVGWSQEEMVDRAETSRRPTPPTQRTDRPTPRPEPRLPAPVPRREDSPVQLQQFVGLCSAAELPAYEEYRGWAPPVHAASRDQVGLVLADIVAAEGPVMGSRIQAAYVSASGGQRVGRAIAQELNSVLTLLLRKGVVVADDPLGRAGVRPRTFRLPGQPPVVQRQLGPRDLVEIPPRELAALLRDAATVTGWSSPESLFREALRRLGRVRLTAGVRQTLSETLPLAVADRDAGGGDEASN